MEKKDLKKLAKEMNKVMGLDPAIDLKLDAEKLEDYIKKSLDEVYDTDIEPENEGDDCFSDAAVKTLAELGHEYAQKYLEKQDEGEEEPEPEPEEKKPSRRSSSKGKKKEEPKKEEKPSRSKGSKKEEPKQSKKSDKEPTTRKMTRLDSIVQGIANAHKQKKNWELDEITKITNELYSSNGGKENHREAKFFVNIAIQCMAGIGVVEFNKEKEHVKFA